MNRKWLELLTVFIVGIAVMTAVRLNELRDDMATLTSKVLLLDQAAAKHETAAYTNE